MSPPDRTPTEAASEDERDALTLSADENADLCAGCSKCCSYITVEVDKPRTAREYDQWLWAIMHRHVSLYVERPERWFLAVETPCENLGADQRCGIYGKHPVLCREYDPRHCERRLPLTDVRAWFHDAPSLERWLEAERPKHWAALLAFRQQMPPAPPSADVRADRRAAATGALVTIGEPRCPEPASR